VTQPQTDHPRRVIEFSTYVELLGFAAFAVAAFMANVVAGCAVAGLSLLFIGWRLG
jgi:hypothetical protein